MDIKFDSHLEYQDDAIASVVDLFRGQECSRSMFSICTGAYNSTLENYQSKGIGLGNRLLISEFEILDNLQQIQLRNGLPQTKDLHGVLDFDIEMETGTGKTYVYSKTMLTLNKSYGFTKFIVVVPNLAIKEGVNKSFQITKQHFSEQCGFGKYKAFVYDSDKADSQAREFATSDYVSIMIINIDSFKRSFDDPEDETKKANIIHRHNDKLNGQKPIDVIKSTNPIVIIDEPQSVDTTDKSSDAIASLNPLCIFRYSATHQKIHNLIYRLDAVDAYEKNLVKGIDVAGFSSVDQHNEAYIKLISVNNKGSAISAKIEVDTERKKGIIKRESISVKKGDDLVAKTKRGIYEGYFVGDIYCEVGNEYISFTPKDLFLKIGESVGGVDDLLIKRKMISKTIQEHLDKEVELNKDGIKVLSLFFIDKVANYRKEDGSKGVFAEMFEEEYARQIRAPKYRAILGGIDPQEQAQTCHNGYFSMDKKGSWKDTTGESEVDGQIYNIIMKDKEGLLSFGSEPANKLRFIFSHSALREGWDNPNVFQICTLNKTQSDFKKRQEIGRGMRLCVNQAGERIHDPRKNQLTIMANESYEEFAATLQNEYETASGIKFGVVERHTFANISITSNNGESHYLGQEKSGEIYEHFKTVGYIDSRGKVQDKLKMDLNSKCLDLPTGFDDLHDAVRAICLKISGRLIIKNNDDKRKIFLSKEVIPEDFQALWERMKYRTKYNLHFDSQKLIDNCIHELDERLDVRPPKLLYNKAKIKVDAGGVTAQGQVPEVASTLDVDPEYLPDIITYLQNRTDLTRKTIVSILVGCSKLDDFKKNPQMFMEQVSKIIEHNVRDMAKDGIAYVKIGDSDYYAQELFKSEDLYGYIDKNMVRTRKSLYEYTVYDSDVERNFALDMDNDDRVKLFFKIPDWFRISTPIGDYNPDWAVFIEFNGGQRLYFVYETKGNIGNNRPSEEFKIECGRRHFKALGTGIQYDVTSSFKNVIFEGDLDIERDDCSAKD